MMNNMNQIKIEILTRSSRRREFKSHVFRLYKPHGEVGKFRLNTPYDPSCHYSYTRNFPFSEVRNPSIIICIDYGAAIIDHETKRMRYEKVFDSIMFLIAFEIWICDL